jgi:hypothetical protein
MLDYHNWNAMNIFKLIKLPGGKTKMSCYTQLQSKLLKQIIIPEKKL